MRTLLVGLVFMATLAHATDCTLLNTMQCERCDPGNVKDASGGTHILCFQCSTANYPDCTPLVQCARCMDDLTRGKSVCTGCSLEVDDGR